MSSGGHRVDTRGAMSDENVEIVRRVYEAAPTRREVLRELYALDYRFDLTQAAPDLGVVRGFDAAFDALAAYWEMFESFHDELEEVIHADEEQVVTAVRDCGRMRGSESEVWNRFFHVFTFRDGKIARVSAQLDRNRALEAAGLSE
jgi:ketosteroid isomerase-like protein